MAVPDVDVRMVATVVFALAIIFITAWLIYEPLRLMARLILQGAGGAVIILLFNLFASFWGLSIGLNPVTALIAGIMGIPGLVLLTCLQLVV